VVLGVSKDSITSHRKFKEKYNLPFPLLSDPDGAVCGLYGVMREKVRAGKKTRGIERSTFVIDREGRISAVWRGVKVEGHAREVLNRLS